MTIDETQAPVSGIDAQQLEEKPAAVTDAQTPEQIAPETPEPTIVAEPATEAALPTEIPVVEETPVVPVVEPVAVAPVIEPEAIAPAVVPHVVEPIVKATPVVAPTAAADGVSTADDGDLFETGAMTISSMWRVEPRLTKDTNRRWDLQLYRTLKEQTVC